MALFRYKAFNKMGERIEDVYEANNPEEVINLLRRNGNRPIKVEEIIHGSKDFNFKFMKKVKIKDIAIFCAQFYTMLNAGVTIIRTLEILKDQTQNNTLKKIIKQIHEDVQMGRTFSEALKRHEGIFPELLINMVEAGEISGTLDVVMDRMANHYEKENKILNKVKSAMTYPVVLAIVSFLVVFFLMVFVVPMFVNLFNHTGAALPLPTVILVSVSRFISTYWYVVILLKVGIIYGFFQYIQSEKGRFLVDSLLLKIPIIKGPVENVIVSRFTRTLSTLLGSGIPLIHALEINAKIVGNVVIKKAILKIKEDVRKGMDLATAIKKADIFPSMLYSMISIGQESGSLEEILNKTANFYDEEVETSIKTMTTLIEPIMIMAMGLIVGGIVSAIMLPMFKILKTIS